MKKVVMAVLASVALSACDKVNLGPGWDDLSYAALTAETRRDYDEAFRDKPFDTGAVSVLVTEHGELRTYNLVPCSGHHICAGGTNGRRGHVERTADYFVVTGAYRGRSFYLSPGGDGYARIGGQYLPLAWN